jgi:uroporphyrinogen-III synthase
MVQTNQPLKGKTIALTRPCGQSDESAQIIKKMGGTPYFIPTIEIKEVSNLEPIKNFIEELNQDKVDYVALMSVNGIKHLLSASEKLNQTGQLLKGLEKTKIIAIGPRTAEELKAYNLHVDLVPTDYTSEGIAQSMLQYDMRGKQVRIPRTTAANPTLKEKLSKEGAIVKEVHVYESAIPTNNELNSDFLQKVKENKIHAIIFGSGLCAKNLFQMLKETDKTELAKLLNQKLAIVAIGPVTAQALSELNVKIDVLPEKYTFEDALIELANFLKT